MMKTGAQCYTLRNYMQNERDIRYSLERVAKIGYTTVQISGIGPIAPQTLHAICEDNGLQIVLTHIPESRLLYDTDAVIREHELWGCRYIGLGAMADRYRSADWIGRFAVDFLPVAQRIKDAGMLFMYHNHHFEFEHLPGGRTIMDVLLDSLPAELMGITLDTYWLQAAGCDVLAWIDILQDRIPCVHLKDMTISGAAQRMAAVGRGNMNFTAILKKLAALGKTEYLLVEQDDCYDESPFDCLQQSHAFLKEHGYE